MVMGYPSIIQDIAQRVLVQMSSTRDEAPVVIIQSAIAENVDDPECSLQLPPLEASIEAKAVAASEVEVEDVDMGKGEQKPIKNSGYIVEPLELMYDRPAISLKKHQNAAIAHETLTCCSEGKFVNENGLEVALPMAKAIETTRLHPARATLPKIPPSKSGPCIVNVVLGSTLAAAETLVGQGLRTCVLNFASAKNPGGGFLNGANAQEEALARASGIYPCLTKAEVQAFYSENERDKSCVYTDNIIISPEVPVFRDDNGCKLEVPYNIGIITSPCPNMGVAATRAGAGGVEAIKAVRRNRMARVLTLCSNEDFDVLVLGAWGCGVFRNDPQEVAEEFRELLRGSFRNVFPRVVFAVIDEPTFGIFCNAFSRDSPFCLAKPKGKTDFSHKDRSPHETVAKPKGKSDSSYKDRKNRRWGKHAGQDQDM
jgi:uncharacterized protein (TIGR02452 family)